MMTRHTPATPRTLVRYSRTLAVVLALVVLEAAPAGATLTPGTVRARAMVFQDRERFYDVWVPAGYDGASPVPLVIDIHGYGSNKTTQRLLSGFAVQAGLHGFLVAYPQGLFGTDANPEGSNLPAGPSWNAGDFCCGDAANTHIDDVGFLNAVAFAIAKEANIDARRVYSTGLSNGGAMTQLLACRSAATIAAAAPMAFPIGLVPLDECRPSRPVSVQHYAGLTDTRVPYDGGLLFPSSAASFAYWRDVTPCVGTSPDVTDVYGSSTCEKYTNCAGATQIGLCSILASAATPFPGHILYINDDLDLAEHAWSFLSQFEAPSPTCGDGQAGAGEECDDGNTEAGDGCGSTCVLEPCGPSAQVACRGTRNDASRLRVQDAAAGADDEIQWTWSRGRRTTKEEFSLPNVDEDLWLCIYSDGRLRSRTRVVAGGTCDDAEPCWTENASGFFYRDSTGGAQGTVRLSLRAGEAGKARIQWRARGQNLEMPGLLSGSVVVQLKKARGGVCWQSAYPEPHRRNRDGRFTAVGD